IGDLMVVAPDIGSVKMARAYAKRLGAELALVDKRRPRADAVEIMNVIGEVEDKNVVFFDDVITTGRTLCQAAEAIRDRGARRDGRGATSSEGGRFMAVIAMPAEKRDGLGKGGARKTRAAGKIPGILYGHGETPLPLSVVGRTFELALQKHRGGNAIVNLALDGSEYTALIRDVQYDPITHDVLHLDFQHISLTEMVEVEVTLHLVGTPIGVKDGGGILETIQRSVEVRCLPTAIPASIDVDVSHLNVGDSV